MVTLTLTDEQAAVLAAVASASKTVKSFGLYDKLKPYQQKGIEAFGAVFVYDYRPPETTLTINGQKATLVTSKENIARVTASLGQMYNGCADVFTHMADTLDPGCTGNYCGLKAKDLRIEGTYNG